MRVIYAERAFAAQDSSRTRELVGIVTHCRDRFELSGPHILCAAKHLSTPIIWVSCERGGCADIPIEIDCGLCIDYSATFGGSPPGRRRSILPSKHLVAFASRGMTEEDALGGRWSEASDFADAVS